MDDVSRKLIEGAAAYGITLSDDAAARMSAYTALVREYSHRMNLVSRGDLDRFAEYHLLDALKTACCVDYTRAGTLLDFGSGAGIPGIPLAIAYPHLAVTLVESRLKRADFLSLAVRELELPRVKVIRARLESLESTDTYDIVVTRATVTLAEFYLQAARFVPPGGVLVAIKGETIEDEFSACNAVLDANLFHMFSTKPPSVPGVRGGNIVIMNRKVVNTQSPR